MWLQLSVHLNKGMVQENLRVEAEKNTTCFCKAFNIVTTGKLQQITVHLQSGFKAWFWTSGTSFPHAIVYLVAIKACIDQELSLDFS